jgi:hypothetical protein
LNIIKLIGTILAAFGVLGVAMMFFRLGKGSSDAENWAIIITFIIAVIITLVGLALRGISSNLILKGEYKYTYWAMKNMDEETRSKLLK